MKSSTVTHGKVSYCLECGGTGDDGSYHGSSTCYRCGGYGLLFDGKGFNTSSTTTTVVPNVKGTELIRPADDIHYHALFNHHRKLLKEKKEAVENYLTKQMQFNGAKQRLEKLGIVEDK